MNMIKNAFAFAFCFSFEGKIGRLHYTIFLLIAYFWGIIWNTIIFPPILYVILVIMRAAFGVTGELVAFGLAMIVSPLVLLLLKFSHVIRRIHDLNLSAFDSYLFFCILGCEIIVGFLALVAKPTEELSIITTSISWLGFFFMVCLAFIPSSNKSKE